MSQWLGWRFGGWSGGWFETLPGKKRGEAMGRINLGRCLEVGWGWLERIREVDELGDFGGISSSKAKIYHCKMVVGILKLEDDVCMSFLSLPVLFHPGDLWFFGQGSRYKVLFFSLDVASFEKFDSRASCETSRMRVPILFQPAAMLWNYNLETPIQLKVHGLGCIPYEHWYIYSVIHVN